jgi:Epoxide hydrolase N terminus
MIEKKLRLPTCCSVELVPARRCGSHDLGWFNGGRHVGGRWIVCSFEVSWDPAWWARVREQVAAYRMPRLPKEAGWRYGCDPAVLVRLRAYWLDGYDANAAAAELNRFPQSLARVDDPVIGDVVLHLVHIVGEAQGRRPRSSHTAGPVRSMISGR